MDAHVVISQIDALRARQKFYFTGEPCKRGHLTVRFAMGGGCVQCDRERDRRRVAGYELSPRYGYGKDIREPRAWENDGGVRREPVIDRNFDPPRVIRHVGWRRSCMCCRKPFFSPDVARVRICLPCKDRPNATNFD